MVANYRSSMIIFPKTSIQLDIFLLNQRCHSLLAITKNAVCVPLYFFDPKLHLNFIYLLWVKGFLSYNNKHELKINVLQLFTSTLWFYLNCQTALILPQRRYHKLRKKSQQENLYFLCFMCFTRTFFLLCALFSYLLET